MSWDDPDDVAVASTKMVKRLHETETCPKCKGKGKVEKQPKPDKPEKPRTRVNYNVRVPKDELENGYEVLSSLVDSAREHLRPFMNWKENVPPYYVLVAVLHDWHQGNT